MDCESSLWAGKPIISFEGEYGGNHTLLAKRLIARSSWFHSLPFWPLKANEKQVNVSWRELVDF
jgi:hypothetical protein